MIEILVWRGDGDSAPQTDPRFDQTSGWDMNVA